MLHAVTHVLLQALCAALNGAFRIIILLCNEKILIAFLFLSYDRTEQVRLSII